MSSCRHRPVLRSALLLLLVGFPSARSVRAQDPAALASVTTTSAGREADLHNYLVTRLRLLKRGTAVEELKSEITGQIDFGVLTPRSIELLRRLMTLCDKAIAAQARVSGQLSTIEARASRSEAQGAATLGKAILSIASSGSIAALLSALPVLGEESTFEKEVASMRAQVAAELGAEISAMEFDIAILRSQIQSEGNLDSREFIGSVDYDQFLHAASVQAEDQRIAAVAAALERSPRMQPAALHLAMHFFQKDEVSKALNYADKVIACSPGVLRRDSLRAHAYLLKAIPPYMEGEFAKASPWADLGLADDPSSAGLIQVKATCLIMTGDHPAALPLFEKLVLLSPQDAASHYNLACCYAVVTKDLSAALASFRAALQRGFTGIAHAKKDPDLELIREEARAEFRSLTTLRLRFQMDWDMLEPDDLLVFNDSAFVVDELEVKLSFHGISGGSFGNTPREWQLERTIKVANLPIGQSQRCVDVINMTQSEFRTVKVEARGEQGDFGAELKLTDLVSRAR